MSISDLIGLDGRLLTTFCVVAEELHFGHAARRLHMSQPPLSQQIKRLEALVGTPLFERTTRSVTLTPAGVVMYERASRLCADMQEMLLLTRQSAQGQTGTLRIGLAPSAAYSPVAQALYDYRQKHPGVVLSLYEMNSVDMPRALQHRDLDAAIMRPYVAPTDLVTHYVHHEPLGLVARHDDAVGGARISLKQVAKLPLIGYEASHSPYFRELTAALFEQAGLQPRIVQESRLPTILTLVEAGVGQAIVPWSLAQLHAQTLKFVQIDELNGRRASLVIATRHDRTSPALTNFVNTLLART